MLWARLCCWCWCSPAFIKNGAPGRAFSLALPICLIYAQLGFTQLFYNNLGAEGMGIQLYFLSPTPMRTVMLAKNLFHSAVFALTILVAVTGDSAPGRS